MKRSFSVMLGGLLLAAVVGIATGCSDGKKKDKTPAAPIGDKPCQVGGK